jgi:hypothetical protein
MLLAWQWAAFRLFVVTLSPALHTKGWSNVCVSVRERVRAGQAERGRSARVL